VWHDTAGAEQKLKLLPAITYVLPSGYKVEMVRPTAGQRWRLIGTTAEGTFCHKPCTVSGGGKSEISKSLSDAMITASVIVNDLKKDLAAAMEIIDYDFSKRYTNPTDPNKPGRPLLSPERSLGSVIRLLTPNPNYTPEYNAWIGTIRSSVRDLVFIIKRFHKPDWESDWTKRFSVDLVNGQPGRQLIYRRDPLSPNTCASVSARKAPGARSASARISHPRKRSRPRTTSARRWSSHTTPSPGCIRM
jgi:hypothetical protein